MSRENEQAFPIAESDGYARTYGLTRREHFAAIVMAGCAAYSGGVKTDGDRDPAVLAREAVMYADALLTELAKVRP